MQTPTLCRTTPALQTVQGMTNLFLLRAGHPGSATLNLNKVRETSQTHPIPKTPSLGSLHSSNKYRLKQTKQHKCYKWISLSTQLLLNSLCPFGTKRCSEPSSQGKTEAERKAVHVHTLAQETSVLLLGRHSFLLLPWIQGTDNGWRFYLASLVNKEVPHV